MYLQTKSTKAISWQYFSIRMINWISSKCKTRLQKLALPKQLLLNPGNLRKALFLVNIFDPIQEIPFAGHPTSGTAFIIGDQLPDKRPDLVTLKLTVGEIPVSLNYVDNVISELTMKQVQPIFGKTFNATDLVKVFNLNVIDFDPNNPIMWVSTGLP